MPGFIYNYIRDIYTELFDENKSVLGVVLFLKTIFLTCRKNIWKKLHFHLIKRVTLMTGKI